MSKRIQEKGILAKLLEKGIQLLIKKECKKIGKININIIASSIQIIKGIIQKIHIIAKDINYKDLLFDQIELEANDIEIIYKINNKELKFKNNLMLKIKLSLSVDSLKKVLLSTKWVWIGERISKSILNKRKIEDIEIKQDQIIIRILEKNNLINKEEKVNLKVLQGKLYLENNNNNFQIPLEDKVYVEEINIENNLIIISAKSPVSFD